MIESRWNSQYFFLSFRQFLTINILFLSLKYIHCVFLMKESINIEFVDQLIRIRIKYLC
jgi:hypothetical protein